MEQAELQLLQLLRGADVPEFTLEISLGEKPAPSSSGSQELRVLKQPIWTITMKVPRGVGRKTTSSSASFSEAWERQSLWWRPEAGSTRLSAVLAFMAATRTDNIQPAELDVLGIVRGDTGRRAAIVIALRAGHWVTILRSPETAETGAAGEGDSFAHAWFNDRPWWEEMPRDLWTGR